MTDDVIWERSSIGERCEILKCRLDRMDEAMADSLTFEPGWTVSKGELERLRRIEQAAKIAEVWLGVGGTSECISARNKLLDALRS